MFVISRNLQVCHEALKSSETIFCVYLNEIKNLF